MKILPVIFKIQFPQAVQYRILEVKYSKYIGVYSFIFPNIERPYYIQVLLTSLAKNVTGLIVTTAIKLQGWKQNLCSQCSHSNSLWTP